MTSAALTDLTQQIADQRAENEILLERNRVLDCFDGLRHHTVVGSNNQDYDVRCLRTTSTH